MAIMESYYPAGFAIGNVRGPEEIRAEMREIAARIASLRERLNVRDTLIDALAGARDMKAACESANGALLDAEEVKSDILELEEELDMLAEEMSEAREIFMNRL